MAPDIDAVSGLLRRNLIYEQVESFIENYDEEIPNGMKPNSPTTSISYGHRKRNSNPINQVEA